VSHPAPSCLFLSLCFNAKAFASKNDGKVNEIKMMKTLKLQK
jgi:hypothetical protein